MKNEYGAQLDSNNYAPSIVQEESGVCFLCYRAGGNLDRHECFGSALRDKSKRLGLWLELCHDTCHLDGVHAHKESREFVQRAAQKAAMREYGWTVDDFRKEFYKNYLDEV